MKMTHWVLAAALAGVVLVVPDKTHAVDDAPTKAAADKSTDKSAEKAAEKPAPADVTTQGEVTANGQHIAYSAIAGTITVGATDEQDAQLGMDGKPQDDTQLAIDAPKEAKDAQPTARMF